ncbi:minor tail protein [Arthrobacter phage Shepard]|nr:minor tail protein [Arthrobacter phage Shepard]
MTLVRTLQTLPNPDGTRRPAEGFFIWTPTERRIISGSPDEVVQPAGFAVKLEAGAFEVDVAATGTDWVWRVDERLDGLRTKTSYVVVPDEAGPVDFTDLASVNTASLRKNAVPDDIWYIYTDYLAEQATLAKQAAANSEAAATSSQDSAAASALISSTKATEASNSAAAALSSAGDADSYAATALAHKNAAEVAKTGASSAQASAAGHASAASAARDDAELAEAGAQLAQSGAVTAQGLSETAQGLAELALADIQTIELNQVTTGLVDAEGHLILTKKDETTVDAGKVILPTTLTVGTVDTGPDEIGNIGPTGPQGLKGDPGGFVLGTGLSMLNLNDIKTSGIYRQTSASYSTPERNYPEASLGVLLVYEVTTGTHLEQEFKPFWFSPTLRHGQVSYRRQFASGNWTPWKAHAATRVDQTSGRVVYQWDPINFRDQLIWGDTGWRVVTLTPNTTVTSGTVRYRRVNDRVSLRFVDVMLSSANNGFGEIISASDVPIGFRPNSSERSMQMIGQTNNATYPQMISVYSAIGWLYQTIGIANSLTRPTSALMGTVNWTTDEVWPTTLPGTAFNTIPNG